MLEFFTSVYNNITILSSGNPVISGVISLWGLTVITYLLRTVPTTIYTFIKSQFISSLEFNNAQGYDHEKVYYACMAWFNNNKQFLKFSRVLSLYVNCKYDEDKRRDIISISLGPGYGTHIFFYKRKLLWMKLERLESSGSEREKRSITLQCLGRDKSIFEKFINEFKPEEPKDTIYTYSYYDKCWNKDSAIIKRPLESVAIDSVIKNKLLNEIDFFNIKESWFISIGLPYKQTYILHGIAGTGKTSLVKALASNYDKNLCIININEMSDASFKDALIKAPNGAMIAIEDFDSSTATKNRIAKVESEGEFFSFLSLSGILNGLDGINSLHDVIIFLTTNHLEKLDTAITRKGRVDHIIELKLVPSIEVKAYSEYIFPEYDFSSYRFEDSLGCNLNSALLSSQTDPKLYLKNLENFNSDK